MIKEFSVKSGNRTEMINIDRQVEKIVWESGVKEGICTIFVPHTTAAVTINENADPNVERDIMMEINKVIPFSDGYAHSEGNSAAHIKSSLFGASETVIVKDSRVCFGTWQSIFLCEFDGPRKRKVIVRVTE